MVNVKFALWVVSRYLPHSRRERTREIACTALANVARNTPELLESLRDAVSALTICVW